MTENETAAIAVHSKLSSPPDELKLCAIDADDETSSSKTLVFSTPSASTRTKPNTTKMTIPHDNNVPCSSSTKDTGDNNNEHFANHRVSTGEDVADASTCSSNKATEKKTLCPSMCSISYRQLIDFHRDACAKFGSAAYSTMTMRDINEQIIAPSCERKGMPLALQLNPRGCKVDAFVTHSWDEPFSDFVESIEKVFHTWAGTKPNLWICSFALLQGDDATIDQQLGATTDSPLEESPFIKALEKASSFVVVRNATTDIYSRIWCVCELMHAKKVGLVPEQTYVTGPNVFADLETSCLDAMSSNPKDKARILKLLLNDFNYQGIDDVVQKFREHEEAPAIFSNKIVVEQDDDDDYFEDATETLYAIEIEDENVFGSNCFNSCCISACGRKIISRFLFRALFTFTLIVGLHFSIRIQEKQNTVNKASRIDHIKAFLIDHKISSPAKLDSFGSSENMAMTWIADHDERKIDIGDKFFLQRYVLALLYYATEGDRWVDNHGWLGATIESDWYGINTDLSITATSQEIKKVNADEVSRSVRNVEDVLSIDLALNDLRGSIPQELFLLSNLKSLFLNDNQLTGYIPTLISKLSNLERIWIQDNELEGIIPAELWLMENITFLSAHSNFLSGIIPKNSPLCLKQPMDIYIEMDCRQCPDSKSNGDGGLCCDSCWKDSYSTSLKWREPTMDDGLTSGALADILNYSGPGLRCGASGEFSLLEQDITERNSKQLILRE
mmetsp:Transcript_29808/g.45696  ORF Transcript_29808/g.45696 Transcript_29808/m.45696 type:complete len:730 (-) Transcript_29808:93-2282(-)|eukprot:CAMPEP_0195283112 /NCGR_PEP_ID=MMETSP0707-20130614/1767_1 /TAXON_ID=33640 /ORGANISM="Asterionellopsis glacialis, Strain CCMP134" /LENGTH=729 /DNA_ID=CAMNT_0040342223 /DNA_START=36 /DNA_END=2225 /DNA_ORIENTATION=-